MSGLVFLNDETKRSSRLGRTHMTDRLRSAGEIALGFVPGKTHTKLGRV
jgi:hypothetical protein